MRAAVLGGGPGGLNFAISLKLRDASHDVLVIERNKPDDTFGWGVVLSDETLGNLHTNDPVSSKAIRDSFVYWDDIAVHYRGAVMRSGGHGFSGIGRKRLLNILQDRARSLGVKIKFETEAARSTATRTTTSLSALMASILVSARRTPMHSSLTSTFGRANTSGSERTRNSTMHSPLSLKRPSTAGSGCTPINSMPTRRPSLLSARKRHGGVPASTA